jgi:hypothetical protein
MSDETALSTPASAFLLFCDGRLASGLLSEIVLPRLTTIPYYTEYIRPFLTKGVKYIGGLSIVKWILGFSFIVLVCLVDPKSKGRLTVTLPVSVPVPVPVPVGVSDELGDEVDGNKNAREQEREQGEEELHQGSQQQAQTSNSNGDGDSNSNSNSDGDGDRPVPTPHQRNRLSLTVLPLVLTRAFCRIVVMRD